MGRKTKIKYQNSIYLFTDNDEDHYILNNGKSLIKAIISPYIFLIINFASLFITSILYTLYHTTKKDFSSAIYMSSSNKAVILAIIINCVFALLFVYIYGKKTIPKFESLTINSRLNINDNLQDLFKNILFVGTMALALRFVIEIINKLSGLSLSIIPEPMLFGIQKKNIFIIIFLTFIVPFYEEIGRFILMYNLSNLSKRNFIVINIVQAIVFALMHINIHTIICFLIFNLFIGYIYKKYKSIKLAIILHMIFNLIVAFNL